MPAARPYDYCPPCNRPRISRTYGATRYGFKNNGAGVAPIEDIPDHMKDVKIRG